MDNSYVAVIIGITVPCTILVIICIIIFIFRSRLSNTSNGYNQVNHALDDEEIEFKRMIEMQGGTSDDIDNLYDNEFEDDLEFSSSDLSRLEILEKYRNSLLASALSSPKDSDIDADGITGNLQL